jgi:hypothetical protein
LRRRRARHARYLDHLVTLPVRVGEVDARFVLDTGIGPTILTEILARDVGCKPNGETLTDLRPAPVGRSGGPARLRCGAWST